MSLSTHSKLVVCFLLMFGLGLNGLPASSAAQSASAIPALSSASANAIAPGMVEVRGERFSPGGLVYIALYDGWGTVLHETRWVASSPTVYGVNGSHDPAQGFVQGGRIEEAFAAYRQSVYGPNGSQDPAQEYVAGDDGGQAFATACDAPLMVRAFDQRTASWSNLLDVESGC